MLISPLLRPRAAQKRSFFRVRVEARQHDQPEKLEAVGAAGVSFAGGLYTSQRTPFPLRLGARRR